MAGAGAERRPDGLPVPVPGVPQRRREPEGLIPRAFRSARRNRHISVPAAVPPVVWTAGEILHAAGQGPAAAVGGAVLTGCVCYFSARRWDRRAEQWYARATAAGLSGWLTAAAFTGASAGTAGEVLGGVLLAGGAAWGIPWYRHKRPRGMKARERLLAGWDAWWQGHAGGWGLAGSRVIAAQQSRVVVTLRIQLMPGLQSLQHVRAQVHLIESALAGFAPAGMVAVDAVRSDPSQVMIRIKQDNPLRDAVAWDGDLAPRSVHEDAVQGLTETGAWFRVPARVNGFVIGTTRTGKSNDLLVLALQLAGCPDARSVVIDLKGGRSARPMIRSGAADYVITDPDEARLYLLMTEAETAARARNAYAGEEQLLATREIPAVFTLCDEVNPLTSVAAGDPECRRLLGKLASQGSGLEMYVRAYTQYGSLEESVGTEQIRGNLHLRVCYRVEESRHGAYCIPEYSRLDASKLEEPGTSYVKAGPHTHPEQVRSPLLGHPLFLSLAPGIRARAPRPEWLLYCGGEPCPAGGTWQEWWDRRWLRLHPDFRAESPQYAEAAARFGEPPAPAASPVPPPGPQRPAYGDAAETAARIAAEAAGPDVIPSARAADGLAAAVAGGKEAFCDALAAAGPAGISPEMLKEASGMSNTWAHQALRRLAEAGAVTRPRRGVYVPVPGADVHAALAVIEAGDGALLRSRRLRAVR